MDYIIKGINLTNGCFSCPLSSFSQFNNMLVCKCNGQLIRHIYHPEGCPLIPLPENHGRLIDADELIRKLQVRLVEIARKNGDVPDLEHILTQLTTSILINAPTIIEAEGYHENNIQSV